VSKDAKLSAAGIVYITGDKEILLLKRSGEGDHAGEWALPAGKVEEGEEPIDAARRESGEEIGMIPAWNIGLIDRTTSDEGVDFSTFAQRVNKFDPMLNNEHSESGWYKLDALPEPLHPGVKKLFESKNPAMDEKPTIALDRATVRSIDKDGRLHVAVTNISKANICPYLGKEIPDYEALGLDPNKVYKLYRDPEELAKAVKTFNNLPVLNKHVPVSTLDHQPEHIIGTTGSEASFEFPYLRNSMSFWRQDAIDDIQAEDRKELSSAYRYRADMTPGELDGVKFDGVMRDIEGNHVALVEEGRAGSDVVVGDAKPQMEKMIMAKSALLTRKAAFMLGGVAHFLAPKLAADAKLDLSPAFAGVTSKNYKTKKAGIVKGIENAVKGKLAADATPEGLAELLDALECSPVAEGGTMDAEPEPQKDVDAGANDEDDDDDDMSMDAEGLQNFLKDKLSDEDMKAADAFFKKGAKDNPPPTAGTPDVGGKINGKDAEPPVTKAAMDAAIQKASKAATDAAVKNQQEIQSAIRDVRPYVGELDIAFDSAEGVYREAFKALEVDVTDVHPSAFKTILGMQTKAGDKKPAPGASLGMDAAAQKSFNERHPNVARIATV
jgi:8-oxo-dGTP pyrophosphatase MutT (NUDIX family)